MKTILLTLILSSSSLLAKESPTNAFIYSKSACFGTCPVYQIRVFEDGTLIFNGLNHVQKKGVYKFTDSPNLFQDVFQVLDDYDVNDFRDSYVGGYTEDEVCKKRWTDFPTTTMSIQLGGKIKTIVHYHGCMGFDREDDLKAMEDEIDKVLNLEPYIRIKKD